MSVFTVEHLVLFSLYDRTQNIAVGCIGMVRSVVILPTGVSIFCVLPKAYVDASFYAFLSSL